MYRVGGERHHRDFFFSNVTLERRAAKFKTKIQRGFAIGGNMSPLGVFLHLSCWSVESGSVARSRPTPAQRSRHRYSKALNIGAYYQQHARINARHTKSAEQLGDMCLSVPNSLQNRRFLAPVRVNNGRGKGRRDSREPLDPALSKPPSLFLTCVRRCAAPCVSRTSIPCSPRRRSAPNWERPRPRPPPSPPSGVRKTAAAALCVREMKQR